jgi:hypothetical protein
MNNDALVKWMSDKFDGLGIDTLNENINEIKASMTIFNDRLSFLSKVVWGTAGALAMSVLTILTALIIKAIGL